MPKRIIIIIVAIIACVVSTGLSFAYFKLHPTAKLPSASKQIISQPLPSPAVEKNGSLTFDSSLPKTEPCPLNGAKYSTQQRQWWEKHEPLGVMIENHQDARPQSGLSFADVVYEAVAEGGITRFAAIFYCQDAPQVGPVRSARTYFLDFLSEYGEYPLYAHVGGANADGPADALSQLDTYGWTGYNDMDQLSIGFPVFWRDYDRLGHTVATEHTMYSTTSKLWDYAKTNRNITNLVKDGVSWDKNFTAYQFKDDATASELYASQTIHLELWSSDPSYFVDWVYDKKNNAYLRKNGGTVHIDKDTNKQLSAKTIVVLKMQESHANDGYEDNIHLLYQDKGSGQAYVFMDGKQTQATWKKNGRTSRTLLYDTAGKQIAFDRGTIWFTVLPLDGVMTVQ
jgi:hypothetical protein